MAPSLASPPDSLQMLPYFPPGDHLAQQQYATSGTTRHELLRMYNRDLYRLLSIRDDAHFRRQVTHDTSVRNFLQSFLQLKRRPFDTEALITSEQQQQQQEEEQQHESSSDSSSCERRLESLLARRVFMVYMRLGGVSQHDDDNGGRRGAPRAEEKEEVREQQQDDDQQQENDSPGILNMPTILDLCAVYGLSNGRLLRVLLTTLVLRRPQEHLSEMRALTTPIMQTIAHTHSQMMHIRQQQQQQHTDDAAIIVQLTEVGRFLYDLFFTLRTLLEVFPLSALMLQYDHRLPLERTLLGHVALVYESTLPAMFDTLQQMMSTPPSSLSSSSVSDLELYIHQTWFNAVQVGGVIIRECFLVRLDAWIMRDSASSGDNGDRGADTLVDRHIVRVLRQWQQQEQEEEQMKMVEKKQMLVQGQQHFVQSMCQYLHSGRSRQLFPMMQHEDEGEQEMESLEFVFYNLITNSILHVATTLAQESQGDKASSLPAFDMSHTRGSFLLDYNHIHGLTDTLRQWLTQRYTSLRESCIGEFLTVLRSTKQQLNVEIDQQNDYLPQQQQQSPSYPADTPVVSLSSSSSAPLTQYAEQIESIRELFPDLGRGFLHMCLAAFDGDIATVTHHLLEDSLPKHLQDLDRTLEHVPQDNETASRKTPASTAGPTSPSSSSSFRITYNTRAPRASTISDDLAPVPWEHASMFSRVHLGQKKKRGDAKLGKISDDLARRIVESYNYDDEYDDTYDDVVSFDVEGATGRVAGDISDPYSKLRREQQASGERGTAQTRQTPVATTATASHSAERRGSSSRSSSSSDAPQQKPQQQQQPANYQRKEQQKARVANHGRKKKAAKKRFVAMQ